MLGGDAGAGCTYIQQHNPGTNRKRTTWGAHPPDHSLLHRSLYGAAPPGAAALGTAAAAVFPVLVPPPDPSTAAPAASSLRFN